MPQMAPISWLLLFLWFTTILTITSIMNYYNPTMKSLNLSSIKSINPTHFNWKW